MELRQYLAIIQRRKWIIIITTLVLTIAVSVVTFLAVPQYKSSTTLRIGNVTDISYTQLLMNTYSRIVTGGTVRKELRDQLGIDGPLGLQVELIPGTELMVISAERPDPDEAQTVAQTTAEILAAQSREIYQGSGQSTANILFDQLEQAEQDLNDSRTLYDDLLAQSPDDEVALGALVQSITLKERTYGTLLDQYEKARVSEALLANSVSVVEPATRPNRPSSPRVSLNIALGLVIGLISGIALAFLVENLDTRLYTEAKIEEATKLPTIGRIPSAKDDFQIARLNNGHFPQLEAFRRLRTNILSLDDAEDDQVLLITSAQRGEGKSTVAANLAVTLAQSGRRVIIVDCDMRLPTTHKIFDLPNKRGLTSVLTKEVEIDGAVLYSNFPRLSVLTSGPLPPNPTELLGSPQMSALVEKMTEEYDIVLLDTPALLSVADAAVLARLADKVIWVVSKAHTRKRDVETVRRQLAAVQAASVEVVINRASVSSDYTAYGPEVIPVE